MADWSIVDLDDLASSVHGRPLPDPVLRTAWVCAVAREALVLGSTQPDEVVDLEEVARRGVEVVRRHSGGGAVWLHPDHVVAWVDLVIPADDPWWNDDVARASHWVGEVWADALASVGVEATVHRGAMVHRPPWSDLVCFGGVGPGEVLVGGQKAVGVSQRRTREGARFQTVLLRHWDADAIVALLRLDEDQRAEARAALATAAVGVDVDRPTLLAAFTAALHARA